MRIKGQNTEPKYDERGDINPCEGNGYESMAVYKHWEENEAFFGQIKKYLVECGCPDYLEYMEGLEGYVKWKAKEDSGKFMGRSMLRIHGYNI